MLLPPVGPNTLMKISLYVLPEKSMWHRGNSLKLTNSGLVRTGKSICKYISIHVLFKNSPPLEYNYFNKVYLKRRYMKKKSKFSH